MPTKRRRRLIFLVMLLTLLVIVATPLALREQLVVTWYAWQLGSVEDARAEEIINTLVARQARRPLIASLVRIDDASRRDRLSEFAVPALMPYRDTRISSRFGMTEVRRDFDAAGEQGIAAMLRLFSDPEIEVQSFAMWSVAHVKASEALRLTFGTTDKFTMKQELRDLTVRALPRLFTAIGHESTELRANALAVLRGLCPIPPARRQLFAALYDHDPLVRCSAIELLTEFIDPNRDIARELALALEDPDPKVRAAADAALKHFQSPPGY